MIAYEFLNRIGKTAYYLAIDHVDHIEFIKTCKSMFYGSPTSIDHIYMSYKKVIKRNDQGVVIGVVSTNVRCSPDTDGAKKFTIGFP